jgi:hypothetical protein
LSKSNIFSFGFFQNLLGFFRFQENFGKKTTQKRRKKWILTKKRNNPDFYKEKEKNTISAERKKKEIGVEWKSSQHMNAAILNIAYY